MRNLRLVAALTIAAAALSGCANLTGADRMEALRVGLEHIESCDRTYTGGTGVGAAFTFNIVCRAKEPPLPREAGASGSGAPTGATSEPPT